MFGSLAHEVYQGVFTNQIKEVRWIYPERKSIANTKVLTDLDNNLHLVWYETDEYGGYLHYANTNLAKETSAYQVIGLTGPNYKDSFLKSLIYTLGFPLLHLTLFVVFFLSLFVIVIISMIYGNIYGYYNIRRLFQAKILKNIYLATTVFCIVFLGLYAITGIGKIIIMVEDPYWPLVNCQDHYLFIFGVTYVAAMIYIAVTKLNKTEVMNATFVAFAWLYWVFIINLIINLPLMNFIDVPLIS